MNHLSNIDLAQCTLFRTLTSTGTGERATATLQISFSSSLEVGKFAKRSMLTIPHAPLIGFLENQRTGELQELVRGVFTW